MIKVMTYNIRHGLGTDGVVDLPGLARVIKESNADIVGLQEVDRGTKRCGGIDQVKEIADLLGFSWAFGPHFPYQGGEYGVALLSRFPLAKQRVHRLPTAEGAEAKALLQGTIIVNGVPTEVYVTHLEVRDQQVREAQCDVMVDVIAQSQGPALLMGDMNAEPGRFCLSKSLHHIMTDVDATGNHLTFSQGTPDRRIDFIFHTPEWVPLPSAPVVTINSPRSDHLAVVATLELTAEKETVAKTSLRCIGPSS